MSDRNERKIDPAWLRGMTQPRISQPAISRREMLRRTGIGFGALSLGPLLAACGVSGTADNADEQTQSEVDKFWAEQEQNGEFVFANWPYYIDRAKGGEHPSLDMFTKDTGIKVDYKPVVGDVAPFFARISPSLKEGEPTGFDLMVYTNGWYLTQTIANGWLIPLDHSKLPNFEAHASDTVKDPAYDPGNKHTLAWQSGITGIGYDPNKTGREITSWNDLFDPAFKGKVGMMADTTEIGCMAMLSEGIDPVSSTTEDRQTAVEKLQEQRDAGLVRQYYDQGYLRALQDGDTSISMAWSGDIFQSQNSGFPDLQFVVPDEGAVQWTDNMMIPVGAANPLDALEWMNYYYDPQIAATVAAWVGYICPVPEAQEIIATDLGDPGLANSPLVFPTSDMAANLTEYYNFKDFDDFDNWSKTFDPIVQG